MSDTILLVGTEDVLRASGGMQQAATDMQRAANTIDQSLRQHETFMNQWLIDLEVIMKGEGKNETKNQSS